MFIRLSNDSVSTASVILHQINDIIMVTWKAGRGMAYLRHNLAIFENIRKLQNLRHNRWSKSRDRTLPNYDAGVLTTTPKICNELHTKFTLGIRVK